MMMNYFGARTDFVVRQDYASKSNFGVGQGAKAFGETNLVASCRMSVLSLVSIASRFSARSEILRVRRGSAASRKTKGRPEMYTAYGYVYIAVTGRMDRRQLPIGSSRVENQTT